MDAETSTSLLACAHTDVDEAVVVLATFLVVPPPISIDS